MSQPGSFDPPWAPPSRLELSEEARSTKYVASPAERLVKALATISVTLLVVSVSVKLARHIRTHVLHKPAAPVPFWAQSFLSRGGIGVQIVVLAVLVVAFLLATLGRRIR